MKLVKWAALALLVSGMQIQGMTASNASGGAAVASTYDCGAPVAKPGGGIYTCTFADLFDGTSLDPTRWYTMDQHNASARSCVLNDPRTVAVSGGSLRLTLRPTDTDLQCPVRSDGTRAAYASGWVNTYGLWSQQYGRFEARMKSPVVLGSGAHEAFWLWPDARYGNATNWPASGEIDIAETYSAHPDLAIPFLHYTFYDNWGPRQGLNTAWNCTAKRGEWHTYALEWTASSITIFVDGTPCLTNTKGSTAFKKRFIVSFAELLGDSGANRYDGTAALPATLEVDYVKAWQ